MATTNRSCNLECVKDKGKGEVIEFIGPVKIVLVDQPPNIYRRRVWGAAFIVLAQMMMAATAMTLLFYALSYQNKFWIALHIFFCTVGFQLCVPSGILSLNKQNGSAAPMRIPDRQFEHLLLQTFGSVLPVIAVILLFLTGSLFKNITLHAFVGMITVILTILTVLTGLLLYGFFGTSKIMEKLGSIIMFLGIIHKVLGIVTFVFSSLCFVLGIWRPRFEMWVPVPQMEMIGMSSKESKDNVARGSEQKSSIRSYKEPNLSDSKTKKNRLKPLRILIVEPKGKYCRTVWCAIGIGITHLMLGATIMTMLIYTLKRGDPHVGVCTIAYHFFSAEAILSLNYANGWSSPLRLRHRRFAHVFLQMCALACAIIGTAMITINKGLSGSVHGLTGIITTALAAISFLSGPCALFGGRYLKVLHMTFGMPTFLMSSICLCFGVLTSAFKSWAGSTTVIIVIAFVVFYSSFIIITCFMKCVVKI